MKIHKLAKLFPEITGEDFKALVKDIKTRGLRQPITTLDGKILDGANRYRACIAADIEPRFEDFTGDNPLAFVVSQNLTRRHLTDDQRAAIAAEIATATAGGDRGHVDNSSISKSGTTVEQAADVFKVHPKQVRRAKRVRTESPAAFKKVKAGKLSLNAAHEEKHPRKPAFNAYGNHDPNLSIYTSAPSVKGHPVHPPPVIVKTSAAPRPTQSVKIENKEEVIRLLDLAYERDKAKLNIIPPPSPLQIVEWCKRVIREA